ncbi:MAG: hypothetical protein OSB44_06110 [Verrucomicrobiales bacterium]|nr:hypothetical protein [Verrucomicrobiales bacterium]
MNKGKQGMEAKLETYNVMVLVFKVLRVVSFLMLSGFAVMDMITTFTLKRRFRD